MELAVWEYREYDLLHRTKRKIDIDWETVFMDFRFNFKIRIDTSHRWGLENWGDGFICNGYSLEKMKDRFEKIKTFNFNSVNVYKGNEKLYGYFHKPKEDEKGFNFSRQWLLCNTTSNGFMFTNPRNRRECVKISYKDFFAALSSKSEQWNK